MGFFSNLLGNANNYNIYGGGELKLDFRDELEMRHLGSITMSPDFTVLGESCFHDWKFSTIELSPILRRIKKHAFAGCDQLKSITLPNSMRLIDECAFRDCSRLTSITIPEGVTCIGDGAFMGCSKLESITIPSSVTSIGANVFYGCSSLESITIPSSVTSIGDQAFCDCKRLTEIVIPSSIKSIAENAFDRCRLLIMVDFPTIESFLTYWNTISFSTGRGWIDKLAVNYLSIGGVEMSSLAIPDGITSIEDCAFAYCSNLKKVIIPSSVTSIGENAFRGCKELTGIAIPFSVTSIGEFAFLLCSFEKLIIPDTVENLDLRALHGLTCNHLEIPYRFIDRITIDCKIKNLYVIADNYEGVKEYIEKHIAKLKNECAKNNRDFLRPNVFIFQNGLINSLEDYDEDYIANWQNEHQMLYNQLEYGKALESFPMGDRPNILNAKMYKMYY